ncbi:MAG: 5'-deoxynucleotidase [Candidatus Howiella sp.]|jgi:5'-deoxynucleotidase
MSSNFFAILSRMKYITRWGLMRNTREENLSEHSLETAMLAHALALIGNRRLGKSYDPGQAALFALYHDATEILTGDLPTPVKYYNPGIRDAYKQIEHSAGDRLLSFLPEDLRPDYAALLSPPVEYLPLVKAADKLSAYIKCMEEEKMGNREFDAAAAATRAAIERLSLPEADIFLREFMDGFGLTLDEQTAENI